MGRHESKSTVNGQVNYDPARSKDVREAGGGKHSSDDKGDQDDQGHEDDDDSGEE